MCKRAELSCISFSKHVCTHRLCTSRRGGCTCSDFGTVTLQTLLNSKLSAREAVQHWFCLCQRSCTGVKEQTKCRSRPTLHIPKQVMGVVTARHDASDILQHKAGTPSTRHFLYLVTRVHVYWVKTNMYAYATEMPAHSVAAKVQLLLTSCNDHRDAYHRLTSGLIITG